MTLRMRAQALFAFCMAQQQPSFSVCSMLQANAQTSPSFAGRPAAICNAVRACSGLAWRAICVPANA